MSTTWSELGKKLLNQAKLNHIPLAAEFELTSRCNLQCKMCYICRPANDRAAMLKERTAKEWIYLAQQARDAGVLYLLLTGGEVFLRDDFKKIYEELSTMGFNIEIYTNATMITPEITRWLGRIPPSSVGVTMYGASPETYAKVCGNAEGYNRAVRGIDLLQSEGIATWLKTTVVRGNLVDFDRLSEFAEKRSMEFGFINYISPRREGCFTHPEAERLSPKDMVQFELHVDRYYEENPRSPKSKPLPEECYLESCLSNELSNTVQNQNKDSALFCSAGKCSCWITWDGLMTPCALMNKPSAMPFEKGFNAAWKEIVDLCSGIPSCSECKECSLRGYCLSCPARLKNETGFYDKPAPYLCGLAKEESLCKRNT